MSASKVLLHMFLPGRDKILLNAGITLIYLYAACFIVYSCYNSFYRRRKRITDKLYSTKSSTVHEQDRTDYENKVYNYSKK